MIVIRDDKYITITFDKNVSMLETCWKQASTEINDFETIKEIISTIADNLVAYHAELYLADQRNRQVVYTLEMQKWIADRLNNGCKRAGVKYAAFINSDNFVAGLSTTQMISEAEEVTTVVREFGDRDSAIKWFGI